MRETPILHAVRAALTRTGRVQLWRSNTGVDLARGVRYGLGVGSADLIGLLSGAGPQRGRFTAFEVKSERGRATTEQAQWGASVRAAGGFYAIVRSPESALEALTRAEHGACE